jgi:ABC-type transport system involved in cytochrome c biogenesis permease subunit
LVIQVNENVKKFLKPIASLRLTVPLLFMSMVLVYAGTSAQKETGIWEVQHWYFHSFFCFIPFKYLLPLSEWWWQHASIPLPGGRSISGFPFVGGYTLIGLLLINLLAAHSVRFKLAWKRTGIIMIHFGLILLLVSEVLTSLLANEAVMSLNDGQSQHYAEDIRDVELAVIDPSSPDHDTVVVVASSRLKTGDVIHDARLPFDLRVDAYYPNAEIQGPQQVAISGGTAKALATAGRTAQLGRLAQPRHSGVGDDSDKTDTPGAFVTPVGNGQPLGTYTLAADSSMMPWTGGQRVDFDGKTYLLQLRFKRVYKPYTIRLIKFTHDQFVGTDMAKNFASKVELIDPANGVDREVVISMNHPLRYHNDTIYQEKFNRMVGGDEGTVLQVVNNTNWLMPYLAVVIGGLGLAIHFGMTLVNFLRKRAAAEAKAGLMPLPCQGKGPGRDRAKDTYTLQPSFPWKTVVPAAFVLSALVVIGSYFTMAVVTRTSGSFDLDAFGKTAVHDEGRTMPLDSLARNYLKIIHGRQDFENKVGDKTETVSAVKWLADVLTKPDVAGEYKVFRVDNDDVKGMLGLKTTEKYFSWNDLFIDHPENPEKLQKQYEQARQVPDKQRDAYQDKIMELYGHATTYMRLARGADYLQLYELMVHPDQAKEFEAKGAAIEDLDASQRTADQRNALERYHRLHSALHDLTLPQQIADEAAAETNPTKKQQLEEDHLETDQQRKQMDLYLPIDPDPAIDPDNRWVGLGQSVLDFRKDGSILPTAAALFGVLNDYREDRPADFNKDLASYQLTLRQLEAGKSAKAAFEVFFNRFDPFTVCMALYVLAFLLVCTYAIAGGRAFANAALAVVIVTFLLHTIGLICRIYISGRPPVTNLYSSAVFIAWGAVALGIGLEMVYRNGIGSFKAAIVGFASLLIADRLAHRDADTMGQLQAVLDTNFWLATHVVCVTLGYAATFLAGVLSIGFVIGNLISGGLESDTRKELARMTYGVICFAMIFSFVGTILGGIWADQSWGRFWGWDPKENGAVLIVLWNALILHARWGGLVKDKGIALLAIFGNIITSWSWFGTNMLGIGLHSYGFMGQAFVVLTIFVLSQIALIIAGLFVPRAGRAPVPVIPVTAR